MTRIATRYQPGDGSIVLQFHGDLDLTVTQEVLAACDLPWSKFTRCVLDLGGVERVFDSGAALVLMLIRHLSATAIEVSVEGAPDRLRQWLDGPSARATLPQSL